MFDLALTMLQVHLLIAAIFYFVVTAPVAYIRLAHATKKQ